MLAFIVQASEVASGTARSRGQARVSGSADDDYSPVYIGRVYRVKPQYGVQWRPLLPSVSGNIEIVFQTLIT